MSKRLSSPCAAEDAFTQSDKKQKDDTDVNNDEELWKRFKRLAEAPFSSLVHSNDIHHSITLRAIIAARKADVNLTHVEVSRI